MKVKIFKVTLITDPTGDDKIKVEYELLDYNILGRILRDARPIEQWTAANIEAAIKELEEVIKTDDLADIEAKTKALTDASAKMAERLYAEQAQQGGEAGAQSAQTDTEQAAGANDDVVDAEFEEVKENKK